MKTILQLITLFIVTSSFAQATLVKDINKGTAGSSPGTKYNFNNEVYFSANDGIHGNELWKTDGTTDGTKLVKDLNPNGNGLTFVFNAIATSNYFFFFGSTEDGLYLWKTDGTSEGTSAIKKLSVGGTFLGKTGNKVIFTAEQKLWSSDGTEAGTIVLKTTSPKNGDAIEYNDLVFYGDNELWQTDGTLAGTKMVKDISTGSGVSLPRSFHKINDKIIFIAHTLATGNEFWISDGTETGTTLVTDLIPGGNGLASRINQVVLNNEVYFEQNGTLWKTNGTAEGTIKIKEDINRIKRLGTTNNKVLVFASTTDFKQIIWSTDGTAANVTSFLPDYTEFSHNGQVGETANNIYFQGTTQIEGFELWKTDGTAEGTVLVKDIHPQSDDNNIENFINFNENIIFSANSGSVYGKELFISDGTSSGTKLIKDINTIPSSSSNPTGYLKFNNKILFSADNGTNGRELWQLENGLATLLSDINPGIISSNPNSFVILNDKVYFKATTKNEGTELWETDGTETGTKLVKDINNGAANGFSNGNITLANNKLYFFATDGTTGEELWESDGTETGTKLVKDINPGEGKSCNNCFVITFKDKVFFSGHSGDNDIEVWESDGTEAGTKLHHNYNFSGSSNPANYIIFKEHLYYRSNGDLLKTNGTTATKVSNIDPGNLTIVGDILFFSAGFSDGGELWATSGETAYKVKEIDSSTRGSFPSFLTNVNGTLFFIANNGNGNELWKSDGTEAGTVMIKDIIPNNRNLRIFGIGVLDGKAFFAAPQAPDVNEFANSELWVSDGTEEGTKLFQDINKSDSQFQSGSSPKVFFTVDNVMYFTASNDTSGHELWMLEDSALSTSDIKKETLSNLTTYPNPVSDKLTVDVKNQQVESFKLFNILGKQVMQSRLNNNVISITHLPKGMYILQLKTNKTTLTKKIIKQ